MPLLCYDGHVVCPCWVGFGLKPWSSAWAMFSVKLEWIFFSVVFGPCLFKHAKNHPNFVICGLCPINLLWILHFCTQYLIAAFFWTKIHWGRELLSFWIWIDVQLQLSFQRSTSIHANIRMDNNCRVHEIRIQDYFSTKWRLCY